MATHHDFRFIANGLSELITFRYAEVDGYWAPGVLCRALVGRGASQVTFDVMSGRAEPDLRMLKVVAKHHRLWLEKRLHEGSLTSWFAAAGVTIAFTPPGAVREYSLADLRCDSTTQRDVTVD